MREKSINRVVEDACLAELEDRGMRRTQRLDDARRLLMRKQLPTAQNPTTWGNTQFPRYLDAFCAHFNVDLGVADWPVREPQRKPGEGVIVKIRDRGVVRTCLGFAGRRELAGRISELTSDEIEEIGTRASAMIHSGAEQDPYKAIGLVAAEILEARAAEDGAREQPVGDGFSP